MYREGRMLLDSLSLAVSPLLCSLCSSRLCVCISPHPATFPPLLNLSPSSLYLCVQCSFIHPPKEAAAHVLSPPSFTRCVPIFGNDAAAVVSRGGGERESGRRRRRPGQKRQRQQRRQQQQQPLGDAESNPHRAHGHSNRVQEEEQQQQQLRQRRQRQHPLLPYYYTLRRRRRRPR